MAAVAKVADLVEDAKGTADAGRLRELSDHRSVRVRQAVASNPASSDAIVEQMLADDSSVVRLSAASNLAERPRVQGIAANSSDEWVRSVLAHSFRWTFDRSLSYEVQAKLAADRNVECRARVAETTNYLDLFEALLVDPHDRVRGRCAGNPRITREQMQVLVADPSATVRSFAASSGMVYPDDEQLLRLAGDRSSTVRWHVLFRVDRPRKAIEVISADSDDINRQHAQLALRNNHNIISSEVEESARERRRQAARLAPFLSRPL